MRTSDVINFLKLHKLSPAECESVMNALLSQPEILTGSIVLKQRIDFLADALCDEEDVHDPAKIKAVQEQAIKNFHEHLFYGTDGEIDDLLDLSVTEAFNRICKK